MFNGDPPLHQAPTLSTEIIQKYLEENKELIMVILECQNQGKFAEADQCLARLQHNLTNLAKLADAAPQAQTNSQGQGMQHLTPPHVPMPQQQQDPPTLSPPFDMNEQMQQHHDHQQQQRQQHHLAMSRQQSDLSTSRLPFQMNEQQHKGPGFFQQQQQLIPGAMGGIFVGTNSGMYQAAQARLSNMSDMPETSQFGSDVSSSGWSLGMSPSGPTSGNRRS